MRNSSIEMLLRYFYIAMFISALSFAMYLFSLTSTTVDATYDNAKKVTDRNQISILKITGPYTVSGAQVLQSIYQIKDIGCNIIVDGVVFEPDLDIKQTNVSMISVKRTYKPTYSRDINGALLRVTFTSE